MNECLALLRYGSTVPRTVTYTSVISNILILYRVTYTSVISNILILYYVYLYTVIYIPVGTVHPPVIVNSAQRYGSRYTGSQ